jgi:hypothetical protein
VAEGLWLGSVAAVTLERVLYLEMVDTRWKALLGLAWLVNLSWALFLPWIVFVSLRWPLRARPGPIAAHVATFFAALVAESAIYVAGEDAFLDVIRWAPGVGLGFTDKMRNAMAGHFAMACFAYGSIAGATHAYAYRWMFRDRRLRAARLEAQLARAQLQALRSELRPHFLFNALNAVSTLMHRDPDAADTVLARLGDLLRASLDPRAHEVTLEEELEVLGHYLGIERTRYGDRLAVRLDVAPDALPARVPHLLLQPLVENAIRHGIAPRPGPGRVEVRARRDGDDLHVVVRDDGLGGDALPRERGVPGLGLSNTRRRLRRLYGRRQRFRACPAPEGGFVVSMRLPFHETPPPAAGDRA